MFIYPLYFELSARLVFIFKKITSICLAVTYFIIIPLLLLFFNNNNILGDFNKKMNLLN